MSDLRTYTINEIEEHTGFDKRTIAYYVQQGLLPKVGRRGPKTRYPQVFLDRLQFVKLVRDKQDRGELGSLTLAEIRAMLERLPEEMVGDVVAGREPLQTADFRTPDLAPAPAPSPRVEAFADARRFEDRQFGAAQPEPQITFPSTPTAVDPAPTPSPVPAESFMDLNRKVRLGIMDASSQVRPPLAVPAAAAASAAAVATPNPGPTAAPSPIAAAPPSQPARAPETGLALPAEPGDAPAPAEGASPDPFHEATDRMVSERIGWALARLQRSLTNAPKRNRGTTESWHRARITPELTISARNLPDEQAYLLDNLARILKKLLWEAWEE
jgi:DNA-binding transcriptional MerR regulator